MTNNQNQFEICYKRNLQDPILAAQTLPVVQTLFNEYETLNKELEEIGKQDKELYSKDVLECISSTLEHDKERFRDEIYELDDNFQENNFSKCYISRTQQGHKYSQHLLAIRAFHASRKHLLVSRRIIFDSKINVENELVKKTFNHCTRHFSKYNKIWLH